MADQTTRRVMRLNRVKGDGTPTGDHIQLTVHDPATNEPLEGVVIVIYPMPEDERRTIVETHTHQEKDPQGGRGLYEHVDIKAANDEIFCRAIVSWDGFVGADDRPLVCTDATKLLLDPLIRGQVNKKLFGAEVVEVLAASFR